MWSLFLLRMMLSSPMTLKVDLVSCSIIPPIPTRLAHFDLTTEILAPWKSALSSCCPTPSQFWSIGCFGSLEKVLTPSICRMYSSHSTFNANPSEYFKLVPFLTWFKPRIVRFLAVKNFAFFGLRLPCCTLYLLKVNVWKYKSDESQITSWKKFRHSFINY